MSLRNPVDSLVAANDRLRDFIVNVASRAICCPDALHGSDTPSMYGCANRSGRGLARDYGPAVWRSSVCADLPEARYNFDSWAAVMLTGAVTLMQTRRSRSRSIGAAVNYYAAGLLLTPWGRKYSFVTLAIPAQFCIVNRCRRCCSASSAQKSSVLFQTMPLARHHWPCRFSPTRAVPAGSLWYSPA